MRCLIFYFHILKVLHFFSSIIIKAHINVESIYNWILNIKSLISPINFCSPILITSALSLALKIQINLRIYANYLLKIQCFLLKTVRFFARIFFMQFLINLTLFKILKNLTKLFKIQNKKWQQINKILVMHISKGMPPNNSNNSIYHFA